MSPLFWVLTFTGALGVGVVVGIMLSQRREQQLNQSLRDSFAALSSEALDRNAEHQRRTLETTLKPVHETLKKTQQQLQRIESERNKDYGRLSQQLEEAVRSQDRLREETQSLSQALARPSVQGSYGEVTLRRVIELAGMSRLCDFEEQATAGDFRPDVVVHMPEDRMLPIDAKAPLHHYLAAHQETDPKRSAELLKQFAEGMRKMVLNLSKKEYWAQFEGQALDFVVMFVPGDQFLNAALEHNPGLMEEALSKRVLLTTPSSLMAILRAVAYGWNQQQVAENAEEIRKLGGELYERVAIFAGHLEQLGQKISGSIDQYNQAVGSLDSRVLPTTTKFHELGIRTHKEIPNLTEITTTPRKVQAAERADQSVDEAK